MKYMLDLDNQLRSDIKYQAAQERINMNDLIVKAVKEYLERTVKKDG
jgi:predicted HicB family RNase H-like nuclease